jgi:hypothetical protein
MILATGAAAGLRRRRHAFHDLAVLAMIAVARERRA